MAIKLKAARVNAEMTLDEASRRLGISRNTLISYEKYRTKPDIDKAAEMAFLYGMSVDDIIWSV